MTTKKISIRIDGELIPAAPGASLLETALAHGKFIPSLCHMKGLSSVGACRLCLVEVAGVNRLLPACTTPVTDGMSVTTTSEKLRKYRRITLELLLAERNHICAVCVSNGHCDLQGLATRLGVTSVRYPYTFPKIAVDLTHKKFTLDQNRCILCTRCVRFMNDVAHDTVLNVSERGDRAFIGKFEGKDLTHPWAANVVDLCPVGALLSKDFLNKARAWELDRTASVCTGCSQGCNIIVETRDNTVMRLRPRSNESVNQFFMCDRGRGNYRWLNRRDRLESPSILGANGHATVDWDVALEGAARVLKGKRVFVLASPNLSNEALYLLARLVRKSGGVGAYRVEQGAEATLPGVTDLALRADRAANATGAKLLGFTRSDSPLDLMQPGDALVVADQDLTDADVAAVSKASAIVVVGTAMPANLPKADIILPIATIVEEEGTLTNLRGRVQRFLQAKATPGMARPSWYVLADLLGALGEKADYFVAADAFAALAGSEPAFAGLSFEALGLRGLPVVDSAQFAGAAQ